MSSCSIYIKFGNYVSREYNEGKDILKNDMMNKVCVNQCLKWSKDFQCQLILPLFLRNLFAQTQLFFDYMESSRHVAPFI